MTDRDLDLLIAQKVLKLNGAGWYKRVSCHSQGHVRATGPDDHTEDYPQWKADRYYIRDGHLAEDGTVVGAVFAVPYCSTDWNEAMRVRTHLVREGLGGQLEAAVLERAGTWLMATPRDICVAALAVGADAPSPPIWGEARARARAFREQDHDLEMALVALDATREELDQATHALMGLHEELGKIDGTLRRVLPHGLVYDRRHQRIAALARERDDALAKLPGFKEPEKP